MRNEQADRQCDGQHNEDANQVNTTRKTLPPDGDVPVTAASPASGQNARTNAFHRHLEQKATDLP
jgi:hypothetical protein